MNDQHSYRVSPAFVFLGAVALGVVMALIAVWVALAQPQIDLPEGVTPVAVGNIELTDADLIEEPDQLGSYDAIRAFNARQTLIRDQLNVPAVEVSFIHPDGRGDTATFDIRKRQLSDLPPIFWFQIMVGLVSLFIGGWVLGLRPDDWGARMFALTTLLLPFAAFSAAIYSSRQIALDGGLFRLLSAVNAVGAMGFGIALVGMFTQYPGPLFRPRWILVPAAVFSAAAVMNIAKVGPDNMIGLVILSEMLIALGFGVVQWIKSRREPLNRAGLRWFILVSLVGCSFFVFLSTVPTTLGLSEKALVSQGYAFGFFNIMHIGLALGVMRYRVFNLDRWSYYIWLWLSGMVLIFLLDLALIRFLQDQPWVSLGAALLIAGFLYFPLRQLLLRFLLQRRSATLSGRMPGIVSAALSPTQREHALRWNKLLNEIFDPLAPAESIDETVDEPRIVENGLALLVPGVDGLRARKLRYAQKGKRLFAPNDLDVAANLVQTHDLASESRRAYERGAILERDRISRDVHDNIGAQLLSALHSREVSRKDDLLRDSLNDLRSIINEGFQTEFELYPLLADLKTETTRRLETHGIDLIWRGPGIGAGDDGPVIAFELVNGLRSILREAVSNILRHSGASQAWIGIDVSGKAVTLTMEDDGRGLPPGAQAKGGNGIPNIMERADVLAGECSFGGRGNGMAGTLISVTLPLDFAAARLRKAAE